jgi:predicted nucleic-acid-binding Zn-ribbon protein
MKNGKCTKCGASDVQKVPIVLGHRDYRALTTFSGVKLTEYVCCSCGLVETYLADMRDVDKIKKKSVKVETTE